MNFLRSILFFLSLSFFLFGNEKAQAQELKSHCEVFFSPKDQLAEKLIQLIQEEQKSIHIAIYCLTHRGISEALVQAKRRGVEVEVLVDPFSVKSRYPVGRLSRSGISIFVWDPAVSSVQEKKSRRKKPLMHHKFCIFGGNKVWTGSFNFTYEASLFNRENMILIEDTNIAKRFLEQFRNMKYKGSIAYEEYLTMHPFKKKNKKIGFK